MTSNVFGKALLVGDMESTFRTAGTPNMMTDTFDVGDLQPTPNIARLERNVQRGNFSPVVSRSGRKQQQFSFTHDIMGGGDGSTAPPWGRFLRACGMAQTQIASAGMAYARPEATNGRAGVTLAEGATSSYAGSLARLVVVEVTGAGEATVTSGETPAELSAYSETSVTVTSGTEFAGPQGAKMEMTYTGNLETGDRYYFLFTPTGYLYSPISDPTTLESMYMYSYFGNKRHLLTGARGTFSFAATAGEFGAFNFTFTGDFHKPTDVSFPANSAYSFGNFPTPPMVELADVSMSGAQVACPTTFGFDMSNTVAARLCANASGANDGAIITGRTPSATFNMDAVPVASLDLYGLIESGAASSLSGYVGTAVGNHMMFLLSGQMTNTQYANQDNLRKNDNTMGLVGAEGDDEILIFAG